MPLRVEGARVPLGPGQVPPGRRSRGLADIAPQYVAKSGLCTESELEGARGTSFRIQHVLGASSVGTDGASRFPKLDECAHFHYEHVDLARIQISLVEEDMVKPLSADRESVKHWYMRVVSQGETWMVRRSYENFRLLDEQLHRCIYDRKFSNLPLLPAEAQTDVEDIISKYLLRLSEIAGSVINCGPVLNWLEMDNRGHRLLVPDTDNCPINTPAVAAAYTVKKYQAQAPDELSFEVGDMISVIDMPPPEESIWWRGKRGFLVGFFPCECVSVIGDKVPRHIRLNSSASEPSKSVLRKHGKLIAFFRSFILSRPSRRRLKQSGILKERVFGCDLGEHLQNSGHEIPLVLKCCAEFIEAHGIVDGIYRLSGVTSNIHKLRNAFDEDRVPALYEDDAIIQDIHSVASLLKMYFRELPNPLCTYQLYHQFVAAVQGSHSEDLRLLKMRDVVHKLPPPHYRTLEYLMRHLSRVADRGSDTGMTPRNVAIVWAPNLLRCREFEVGGVAALQFVGVQAVVTEFLVRYVDLIFTDKFPAMPLSHHTGLAKKSRPKSLAISTPTKLLSLEEARNRALLNQQADQQEYIEVGGGPASLPPRYHTVIELPRKRAGSKRSPLGWRMLFGSRGSKGSNGHQRKSSTPADFGLMRDKAVTEADLQSSSSKRRLRPAKSVESLSSAGESPIVVSPPRAPPAAGVTALLRPPDAVNNHNRSVSHDSYFDTLQDDTDDQVFESTLDISEIQVNFELEESEMRIFSEDETLIGSGSISFSSPRPNKLSKSLPMSKRLTAARLARGEDSLSSSQSADPSPKKQKTQDVEPNSRSRLEERLSSSVGELQFIDSVSPDQIWVEAEVHPIQSPSSVSSLSRVSSLLPPTSPILPHIPHLNQSRHSMPETSSPTQRDNQSRFSMPETPPPTRRDNQSPFGMSDIPPLTREDDHSRLSMPDTPPSYNQSSLSMPETPPLNQSGRTTPDTSHLNITSGNESTLTTPDTPLCSSYAPLIESPDPPRPEERKQKPYHPYENVGPLVKTSPVLETSFDVVDTPGNRDSLGSVKYEMISTESSCDSLIDFKKTDESKSLIGLVQKVSEEEEVPEPDSEEDSKVGEVVVAIDTKMDLSDGTLQNAGRTDIQEVESCARAAKELVDFEVNECGSYQSSEESLYGVASMFVEMDKCESCLDCGDFAADIASHDLSTEMSFANLESDIRSDHPNLIILEQRNNVNVGDFLLNIDEEKSQKEETMLDRRLEDFAASLVPSNWMSDFCESQSSNVDNPFDKSQELPDSPVCDQKINDSSAFETFDWLSDVENIQSEDLVTGPDLRDGLVETELSKNLPDPGVGDTTAMETSYWTIDSEKGLSDASLAREQHLGDGTFNLMDNVKVDQSEAEPGRREEADWTAVFDVIQVESSATKECHILEGSEGTDQPGSEVQIGCTDGSEMVDFDANQSESSSARFGDSSLDNDITDDIPIDQSLPGVDLRVGDTSASSEASDWTTVIHKDLSEGVLDTESLSEDTSISSGDSEKVTEAIQEAEKENVPLEKPEKIEGSPMKSIRVARVAEHLSQRPKEIKKPPRKISLDLRKSLEDPQRTRRLEPSVTRRKSSPNSETLAISDLPLLDRSPTLRGAGRRGSSEDKKTGDGLVSRQSGGTSCESSPVHRVTDRCPPACGRRKESWEEMDTSEVLHRLPSDDKKNDIPDVMRVTARLTDRGSPTYGRHSAPSGVSRKTKDSSDSQKQSKDYPESPKRSKAPVESPKRSKEEADWETETPLRSNSSGNVRQLLHKFEGCERGERPRTLERLSTRRAKDSVELDLSDPERRERIERYKEKRRTYLREKYRAEMETARRLPPFEKPPRKHPPPSSAATTTSAGGRRSFEAPTVSSLCRSGQASSLSPTSPQKHRSLDFVPLEPKTSPELKVTSPRRKTSGNTTPPYCIKDMAAIFEKREPTSSQVAAQHKQYLSSV